MKGHKLVNLTDEQFKSLTDTWAERTRLATRLQDVIKELKARIVLLESTIWPT